MERGGSQTRTSVLFQRGKPPLADGSSGRISHQTQRKNFLKPLRSPCSQAKRAVNRLRLGRELGGGNHASRNKAERAAVGFLGRSGALFVIFGVAVDLPEII